MSNTETTPRISLQDLLPAGASLRRSYRAGDIGAITALHGSLYASEYGNDSTFEAMVGDSVARAASEGWPQTNGGLWAIDIRDELRGCIAYTDEGAGVACLRWVLLTPELRGFGLGRGLVTTALDEIRSRGFNRVTLFTFSDLRAAAALYREAGFHITSEETGPRWGRDAVTFQHYALRFH